MPIPKPKTTWEKLTSVSGSVAVSPEGGRDSAVKGPTAADPASRYWMCVTTRKCHRGT